jgi:5-(carboxyamino)imidazole ribonucleotide mutase
MGNRILIVTGSKNDLKHLDEMQKFLRKVKADFFVTTISCHRNLSELVRYFTEDNLNKEKVGVIIAIANSVSNLPAIIAGHIKKLPIPVIGVGMESQNLKGIENLLSVNTIPKGTPIMNTGIGEVGFLNAALCATRIISMNDKSLLKSLQENL